MSGANNENAQINDGPSTLEDAFRLMRQGDQQAPDPAVGDGNLGEGELGGEGSEPEAVQAEGQETGGEGVQHSEEPEGSEQSDPGAGGLAASSEGAGEPDQEEEVEEIDYGGVSQAYIQSTQRLAVEAVNKLFKDQGISKATINDLYNKDEHGRVSFSNPDDPDRPFQSRAEAQQWVEAFNSQIDSEWKRMVQEQQGAYMKEIQPMLRLINFAPEFESMSKAEQDVFDKLIDGYSIKDRAGNVIGYSCDLANAKRVAVDICSGMNNGNEAGNDDQQQSAEDQKISGSGPSVDAQTSGTGNPQNDSNDPKDLAEAMKMLADQKKKAKENK